MVAHSPKILASEEKATTTTTTTIQELIVSHLCPQVFRFIVMISDGERCLSAVHSLNGYLVLYAYLRSVDMSEIFLSLSMFKDILISVVSLTPQWGTEDAEIKVPSGENTELKRSAVKAWSRSVYNHKCYAYCQKFLPYFYPSSPFTCIFSNFSIFFPASALANTGSCVGPQNKKRSPCWMQIPVLSAHGT